MSYRRLMIIFFIGGLIGAGFLAAIAHAQDDGKPEPGAAVAAPEHPAAIDWSQAQMSPHEPSALPDPTAAPNPAPAGGAATTLPPATNLVSYIVQPGDTLFRIARRYGVAVSALAAHNNISNPSRIYVGQAVIIPAQNTPSEPPPAAPVPSGDGRYTVQPGDTLSKIARSYGVTVGVLAVANQIRQPSLIYVGQALIIPAAAPAPPSVTDAPPPTDGAVYTVQRGDSLALIARRFGISVQHLATDNRIATPSRIYPGQTLIITAENGDPAPAEPVPTEGFIWPVESRAIVKGYRPGHRAIDLVLPAGSPVVAIDGGTVEFAGWNSNGYGNLVVVDHGNGWRTLYAHNSAFKVKTGDVVTRGDVLALSGNTGNSTMPHLHLEIILNGKAVSPCLYLPGGC